jgi:hypothetical protein
MSAICELMSSSASASRRLKPNIELYDA